MRVAHIALINYYHATTLGSRLVDLVKFIFKDFIRGSVSQNFSRKTVTPGLDI